MPNPNPINARLAKGEKKRIALAGVMEDLQTALATAVGLLSNEDPSLQLRAVHAVGQTATAYAKLYETGELEVRLEQLIASIEAREKEPISNGYSV